MALKEKLLDDFKEAMRNRNTVAKDTVQIVRAAVLKHEKDNKAELDDAGVLDIIARELKKLNDVLPDYERSGRTDLLETLHKQIEILKGYLPKQLSLQEIDELVKITAKEVGAQTSKDIGKVMQAIGPKVKSIADSKQVSELVKKHLNELQSKE